jgi:phospholipid transport system substrate-binding protein
MKLINDHWKIYDVVIEGVSLVKNYRIQFNSILRKEKPAQLIDRLKKKKIQSN